MTARICKSIQAALCYEMRPYKIPAMQQCAKFHMIAAKI